MDGHVSRIVHFEKVFFSLAIYPVFHIDNSLCAQTHLCVGPFLNGRSGHIHLHITFPCSNESASRVPTGVGDSELERAFTFQQFSCVPGDPDTLSVDLDCQLWTQVSAKLRQAIDISPAQFIGQNVTIAGTETAMIRISSGSPMRQ